MRISTLALAGAFALASTAAFADDPMSNTYANTVTTKSQKTGMSGTLLFNADGSYSASGMGPDGKSMTYQGKWELMNNNASICLTPRIPNPPTRSCSPVAMHNVGDSWSVTNDQGETFDVSLTAGR